MVFFMAHLLFRLYTGQGAKAINFAEQFEQARRFELPTTCLASTDSTTELRLHVYN